MITIIQNITVLVSHNIICFGYFLPMNHGVNKKAPLIAYKTSEMFQGKRM